ncbi:hypothetical protein A1O1_04560 [Capronia coronata CBS 617.96]|uniref:Xylanolytic transcriptional activator regulatory domain-containing protein n=1 Tax=Capronia coronata CBS 617.96 TaxID=1182541 RepID=W9YG01_9EURO|nr:uncharacterized protein A1O1_04560 [Capronia coronata CBS 617.96]EXJ91448.1 hypothetical protein A1O1_04560 [Capronia coronata CBS 617.96]
MSQEIGLNVDPSGWDITPEDRGRRIRLWWMVYMVDKWSALTLGRPSYINEEEYNVPLPTMDNFPRYNYEDLEPPEVGIRQFIGMAVLTTILSDILATFYTLRANTRLQSYSSDLLQLLSDQFEQRLEAFHNTHLTPIYDVHSFLDPTGTIFLAFHTVKITLYRAMLRRLDPTDIQYQPFRIRARLILGEVTMLLQTLTVRRLRVFWWSQLSNHNFAIAGGFMMSLLVTSTNDTEIEYWTSQIKLYYDLLQSQSVGFDTTKLAAARMSLLSSVSQSAGDEIFSGIDSKQAFCGDFRIELCE